jgi:hypothetical protein
MKRKQIFSLILIFLMITVAFYYTSCTKDRATPSLGTNCANVNSKYSTGIKPFVQAKCAVSGCHTSIGTGNGDFTVYEGLAAKGDAPIGNGSLRRRIVNHEPPQMPPNTSLSEEEIQEMDCWLRQGSPNN